MPFTLETALLAKTSVLVSPSVPHPSLSVQGRVSPLAIFIVLVPGRGD